MRSRIILFFLVLISFVFISDFVNAFAIGADYPDYRVYHGHFEGGITIIDPIRFVDDEINPNDRPILLVHGWGNDADLINTRDKEWGDLQAELKKLENKGYDVWRLQYAPANLSNKKNGGVISKAINDILDKGYNVDKVDIVSHSMGGLAIRTYIENFAIDKNGNPVFYKEDIDKFVMIAPPLYGSYFANIVDGITDINLSSEHPKCDEFIKEYKLNGNSEATRDFQIGSDLTWNLNNNLEESVDYLVIAGNKIAEDTIIGLGGDDYCLSNHFEVNDGVVSAIHAHLLQYNYPLAVINRFHAVASSIRDSSTAGKLTTLFFSNNLSKDSADKIIDKNKEAFYRNLGDTITRKGAMVLEIKNSEIKIKNVSLSSGNSNNLKLEQNKITSRWFFINKSGIITRQRIDFTTLMNFGRYNILINSLMYNQFVDINKLSVNFLKINLDEDDDKFDIKVIGGSDCDDSDNKEFPGQKWYLDNDNDGFSEGTIKENCERLNLHKILQELTSSDLDCNDNISIINPGATEMCNEIDDNCNIEVDEVFVDKGNICFAGIGECRNNGTMICSLNGSDTTCNAIPKEPNLEICDGLDNDCNGIVDNDIANISNGSDVGECQIEIRSCIEGKFKATQEEIIQVAEICDDLKDNDCDSLIDKNDTLNCELSVINLIEPNKSVFNERRIKFNITTSFNVEELLFRDNSKERPRNRSLCRDCSEFGNERIKILSLNDGEHNLSIYAVNGSQISLVNLNMFVDSKDPRISKTEPRVRQFSNGTFYIEFQEENPTNLTIYYGNNIKYKEINISKDCILDRNRYICSSQVDLTEFHNKTIEYWFNLSDIAGNFDENRAIKINIDTISPIINSFNFSIDKRRVQFFFNVTEKNLEEINYMDLNDSRPREIRLCSRLKDEICESSKSFRVGEHHLIINMLDKAGNAVQRGINFTIV